MNKTVKTLLVIISIIIVAVVWLGESRQFYCVNSGQCITVWKTYGGTCYVVPGKYYGLIKPSDNYIQTTNIQFLTIYFSYKIPNTMVVRNQRTSDGTQGEYVIYTKSKGDITIMDYSEKLDTILYKPNAVRLRDVRPNTYLIDLGIKEGYAKDQDGKKL